MEKADNDGHTPLINAARSGCLDMARYLLEQGADRDKASDFGSTPLHLAANRNRLRMVKLFMVYGADLNARTNRGHLPIDLARSEEIEQAIRDEPRRRLASEPPSKTDTPMQRHKLRHNRRKKRRRR